MITKIPIHVQASKELSLLEAENPSKLMPLSGVVRKPNPFASNAYPISPNFTGTQVKEGGGKTQFRIRPQTPKLDMILLKKAQRKQLTKIEPLPAKKVKIKKPVNKIQMRKIKIKRKESSEKADKRTEQCETSDMPSPTVVQTQQNFYEQKLDVRLEQKLKNENSDEDAVFEPEKRQETGVLFGAAYENTYIDILENEGVWDATEINERLLEISLGMDKEELRNLEKIEIVVDTTNTHMQHVGEVLTNLRALKLNDSVIPSIRDLGTSFKNLQVLNLSRWEMTSLAGLSSFEFLKELYASYNDIKDCFDVSYWYHLEVLDLEGNNISTWDNVSYLMGLDQLIDVNLSSNPIWEEHNYHNRVKEMLRQVKYIDDIHTDAIEPEAEKLDYLEDAMLEYKVADEKLFVLSKFAKFDCLKVDDLFALADEAIKKLPQDEKDDGLVKKKVKRHERKYKAFEKETFDVFDYGNDDGSDIDDFTDDNTPKEIKKKMWRSQTNGFFKRKDSDLAPASSLMNRSNAYDDSDSVFRSSLRGFFTGRNKENRIDKNTFYASSNSTRETNEYSTLITNTDQAFWGNPLKALKHSRKNMFSNYGSSDIVEAKGIEELLQDFNKSASNFKNSMKNLDVAEKLKQNHKNNKLQDWIEDVWEPQSTKISKEAMILSRKKFSKEAIKGMPIKAEHVLKKSMIKMKSQP